MQYIGNIDVSGQQDAAYEEMFGEYYRKRKRLAEAGVPVSPERFDRTLTAQQLRDMADALTAARDAGQMPEEIHACAGRIANIREHKRSTFIDLIEGTGRVQTLVDRQKLEGTQQVIYENLDRGDFLGVRGFPFATRTGEPTIRAQELVFLGKTLRDVPDIGTPLDVETQYRQRYLDLVVNPEATKRFVLRSRCISAIRRFMEENSFMEVETPIVDSLATGALAKPFGTHHNALDIDCQLRIAPEIPLKKLIIGGFERVFEIGKQFRNEGMSPEHMQEFTTMEFYWAYTNYRQLMDFTEEWFRQVVGRTLGSTQFAYEENTIDLSGPWARKTFQELILDHVGIDVDMYPEQAALEVAANAKTGGDYTGKSTRGGTIDLLYKKHVRGNLVQPTFILGHTADESPLARRNDDNPTLVDRFQVVMGGTEVVNAYSELVDPIDQRIRFEEQARAKAAGDEEAHAIDREYLRAMEHGMPPIAGWGVGVDRLIMMMTQQQNIRDVVLFPIMRPRDLV
ncbi:lysine--tRNA ligase [Candidatus Peregrinibacteria bacterium CG10_big_fil_rev_8_21_14_0_10_55_24]|nr:MAG: lysine--tRNA ligase [Candidatus Peregrinibacteria bacterium CG10_big_fil_rev_8_21_14_0_10_55_24]